MDKKVRTAVRDYFVIAVLCIPYAAAINWFLDANGIACGGFTGIAQMLHALVPALPIGGLVLAFNLPLFVLGWRIFGWGFVARSLWAVVLSSLAIDALAGVHTLQPIDPLLACAYGGALLGAALGLMLRFDATTGGTELGARLLKLRFAGISIGRMCLLLDLAVIGLCALVFGRLESALYGGAALYISTLVMDAVIYGGSAAKVAYIISARHDEITQALLDREMGVTILSARGAYTGAEHPVLLCAIRRREMAAVRRTVKQLDPDAFFIVCDAREVLGEGFSAYDPNGL